MSRPLLFIVLIILLLAALPAWPYSVGWGYYPSGGVGMVLLVVLNLVLLGRITSVGQALPLPACQRVFQQVLLRRLHVRLVHPE